MKFIINGGRPLSGEVSLSGAKNAASKVLIASLLTDKTCHFTNLPAIGEMDIVLDLCRLIGSEIKREDHSVTITTPIIKNHQATSLHRRNRIPILALGPLLARVHKAEIPFLGGDKIGPRPVDFHISALEKMGAVFTVADDTYKASAPNGLHGADITLNFPSVGATENIILAATLAKGRTVIRNAAIEPEILDIIKLLQKMGAIVEMGANRAIYIDGVKSLKGAVHSIIPDRNEAVSFAALAVATGGRIKVKNALQDHLITFLNALRRLGGEYIIENDGIVFYRGSQTLSAVNLETDTHPGFMTDWQQPFVVLLTQSHGVSIVHETIYEDRFGYTDDLNLMGANIKVVTQCLGELSCRYQGKNFRHSAIINGPTPLTGANLTVRDLRAGMAHIIAALTASGKSSLDNIEEIDRGYADIDNRLRSLNADITRQPS